MRRFVPWLVLLAAVAAVVIALSSGGGSTTEVDAIFDSAKGMVPGQLVKVAGTRVGTVTGLDLIHTSDSGYEARMRLSISNRFMPFHSDATCQILPEGLISENFVECNPGTPVSPPLARGSNGVPTVPVTHTSEAVSLEDVFNVFSVPTAERVQLFLDTLGVGTAGRGQDLNSILRRANPSLTQADRVLAILGAQNHQIATAVGQTDQVLTELANGSASVRSFVDRAASVARTTAAHRGALESGVHGLPAMLTAVKHGLISLDRVAAQGTPLLDDLRTSAPYLESLTYSFPAFTKVATPALRAIGAAAAQGTAAIPSALPVVAHLNRFATSARPVAKLLDELLVNLRQTGGIEGLLRFLYGFQSFLAAYDSVSHFPTEFVNIFPECIFSNAGDAPLPGCSHAYSAPDHGQVPLNAPNVSPGPNTAVFWKTNGSFSAARPQHGSTQLSAAQLSGLLRYLLK